MRRIADRTRGLCHGGLYVAVALVCMSALASSSASSDLCGATIVSDLKLVHDLTCPGNGLTIGANGIRLDLDGNTIAGSGTGVGISVVGRTNVLIRGGSVQNFGTAIRIASSSGIVVKESEFLRNAEGVDCQAGCVGNTIKENVFQESSTRAIMLRGGSAGNTIKENTFTANRVGVLLFGATGTTVKENIVAWSTLAGIRVNVFATGNLIAENDVLFNPAGIELLVTMTGSATGNTFGENTIAMNTCGIKGPAAGNLFTGNVFEGNASDSCS